MSNKNNFKNFSGCEDLKELTVTDSESLKRASSINSFSGFEPSPKRSRNENSSTLLNPYTPVHNNRTILEKQIQIQRQMLAQRQIMLNNNQTANSGIISQDLAPNGKMLSGIFILDLFNVNILFQISFFRFF